LILVSRTKIPMLAYVTLMNYHYTL